MWASSAVPSLGAVLVSGSELYQSLDTLTPSQTDSQTDSQTASRTASRTVLDKTIEPTGSTPEFSEVATDYFPEQDEHGKRLEETELKITESTLEDLVANITADLNLTESSTDDSTIKNQILRLDPSFKITPSSEEQSPLNRWISECGFLTVCTQWETTVATFLVLLLVVGALGSAWLKLQREDVVVEAAAYNQRKRRRKRKRRSTD